MARKRAGSTVKVSVSLDEEDLATLKRRAREAHGGNLSAAFAEAARKLRQHEAREQLLALFRRPPLTPEAAAAIEAELRGGHRYEPKKPRRKRAA